MNGHSRPSSNDDNANDKLPSSTKLCLFQDPQSPIELKFVQNIPNVSCHRLEDGLDDPLDPTMEFPVEYPQLDDALLLQCRLPKPRTLLQESSPKKQQQGNEDNPMASITGLPEEFPGTHPLLNVKYYRGNDLLDNNNNNSSTTCICQQGPAHSLWKRQTMDVLEKKQSISPYNNNNNNGSGSTTTTTNEAALNILWIDLRSCSALCKNPSLGAVVHLFRNIFGTSHAVSPWTPSGEQIPKLPHRVALIFPNAAPDNIFNVRVGDICPSWALYSISRLQVPADSWSPWEYSTGKTASVDDALLQSATLLIYKPLPPRPLVTLSPPPRIPMDDSSAVLGQLPLGCLWETYFVYHEEDGPEEKKLNPEGAPTRNVKTPHSRMVAPPYISHQQEYISALWKPLLEHWQIIRDEALRIPQWTAWPERQHYSKAISSSADIDEDEDDPDNFHPTWTVFPLCHCFPANIPEKKKWIDQTCAFVPQTIQLLQNHLGPVLRTALFSRLDPETTLEAHTGWADLANHVIRCHLPLVVPPGGLCGTWVDGCVETHEEGRLLCFDDSKVHRAFNYSRQERIVLILDLARPDNMPVGTATGGHSEELDQFIAQMNLS